MAYKYIPPEKIKEKKRSSRDCGIVMGIISAIMTFLSVFFTLFLKIKKGYTIPLLFAIIFLVLAVYFFNQVKIKTKKSLALDDPNSKIYKRKQTALKRKRNRYLRKAVKHKSLRAILHFKAALVWGLGTIAMWLLNLIAFIAGYIFPLGIIASVIITVIFFSTLIGNEYKSLITEYANHGVDRKDAENDFSQSKAYITGINVISISNRFFLSSENKIVIDIRDIVWVFSGFDNIHKYQNATYIHTERRFCIIIGLTDGRTIKVVCPEELCPVLIDDITSAGTIVTAGYSIEFDELFRKDPKNFRSAYKTGTNVKTDPIGPYSV